MHDNTIKNYREIGNPIEFRGLKAQYILYAIVLIAATMLFFAILYICGVPVLICSAICLCAAATGIATLYRLSSRYGPYGWRKKRLAAQLPAAIRFPTRTVFTTLIKWNEKDY